MISSLDKYVPFELVSNNDLIKARLFNKCRLGDTGCWIWTGPTRAGYGIFYAGNKDRSAHRISYEAFVGKIPDGMVLRHSCDTPACINPAHLTPGTQKENVADRESRGRRDVRGEQIGTSKLTSIEALFTKISDISIKDLSDAFGVSEGYMYRVRNGQSWEHLNVAALWERLNMVADGVTYGD